MEKLKPKQIWHCIIFPNRAVKLLRPFEKKPGDRYFEFRPKGWLVLGLTDGKPYGSDYEITEESLRHGFSHSAFIFFKRLLRLRIKFYYK